MDTKELLQLATEIVDTIDHVREILNSTSSSLIAIRSRIVLLQVEFERTESWLRESQPQWRAEVWHGLQLSGRTAYIAMSRLQKGLNDMSRARTLNARSNGQPLDQTPVSYESGLKRHLIDVEQSLALIRLALSVCEL